MPTLEQQPIDDATARRVEQSIKDGARRMGARQRAVEGLFALISVIAAIALALLADADRSLSLPLAAAFVVAYAGVASVAFNVGAGYVVPTQLVFIPMLLLLPTPVVPLLVAAGLVLARCSRAIRDRSSLSRSVLAVSDGDTPRGVLRGVKYEFELACRDGEWRITRLRHDVLWATAAPQSGPTGEPLPD